VDPHDSIVDAGVVAAFMENAVLPWDTVGYQQPGYWDRPFINNAVIDVPVAARPRTWTTIVDQNPPEDPYALIIQKYILTTTEPLPTTGVQFRIRTERAILAHTEFGVGVERHRGAEFPFRYVSLFHPVTTNDSIMLECRNTTGSTIRVAGALLGWYNWDPDSAGELDNQDEGMVDV